jgi:hypothetical protein
LRTKGCVLCRGCTDCFSDVGAADRFYVGMATAAVERNITIQYCLPSATDMLESLSLAAVIQARASGDYARPEGNTKPWSNVVTLGGASLLMGATRMAPSKDTLWTASPQPDTSSDRTQSGYHTQPHVQLDAILAVLSLGPVGISDALNYTDAGLISQGFRSATDSTLLRPSRPLSTVDAVFTNHSRVGRDDTSSAGAAAAASPPPAAAMCGEWKFRVGYGPDLGKPSTTVSSAAACCSFCHNTSGCKFWTWNGPPPGGNGGCFAKGGNDVTAGSPAMVSGGITPGTSNSFVIQMTNKTAAGCTSTGNTDAPASCCLDLSNWDTAPGALFAADDCHPSVKGNNQIFTASAPKVDGSHKWAQLRISLDGFCLTAGPKVTASPCVVGSAAQLWSFDHDGTVRNKAGTCLATNQYPAVDGGPPLTTAACDASDGQQQFTRVSAQPDIDPDIAKSTGPDIRATHAALGGGGAKSHYVLAWRTTTEVTLQATDLYPAPPENAKLAVRKHIVEPAGDAQWAGCEDGKPASDCVTILAAGAKPTIGAVGGAIQNYSLTVVYEPQSNGEFVLSLSPLNLGNRLNLRPDNIMLL